MPEEAAGPAVWQLQEHDAPADAHVPHLGIPAGAGGGENHGHTGVSQDLWAVREGEEAVAGRDSTVDCVACLDGPTDGKRTAAHAVLLTDAVAEQLAIAHQSDRVGV